MEKIHKEILGLMGKIDINCRDEGDVIVIELSGQLDIYNSGDLNRLIDAYIQRGFQKFVVNLEKVSYWDSSTLSVFINCMRSLEELNGKFLLAGLQGSPREVFEMAKLDQVFSVFPNVGQALEAAG
ncbi:MAG: STAS domain-containing protein [Candidatus Nitrohelix vancouverensis]|uniref:Anti-sigma factor antagonist n=1 Tax=Candidatus Nitrohelix vancouverensis TaxID=2705534 RepID=A0A7T0G351_9BACT|nr:MAG: STAS domain-containing protein [Candidatus Nitrohelix vancouverensis]